MTEQGIIVAFCIIAVGFFALGAAVILAYRDIDRQRRRVDRLLTAFVDTLPRDGPLRGRAREFVETDP